MSLDHCEQCGQAHPKCHGHKKHVWPPVPCGAWPPKGQDICTKHGGGAKQVREAGKRRAALQEAEAELDRLGVPINVDVAEAMVAMVHEAAGNVAFLRMRVQELEQAGRLTGNHDPDDIVSAIAEEENPRPSIAGRVDPKNWKAEPHVLVSMYNDERERLVRWSKACRDAGVGDRLVELQEQQGQILAEAFLSYGGLLAGALIQAGLAEAVVQRVVNEQARPLMRQALEAVVREEGASP